MEIFNHIGEAAILAAKGRDAGKEKRPLGASNFKATTEVTASHGPGIMNTKTLMTAGPGFGV